MENFNMAIPGGEGSRPPVPPSGFDHVYLQNALSKTMGSGECSMMTDLF